MSVRDFETIDVAIRALRGHFHEWSNSYESDYDLMCFAYYEECRVEECCRSILAHAAPFVLGKTLVNRYGFRWIMVEAADSWHFAVCHPSIQLPIDLMTLEGADGSPNETPQTGERTLRSLAKIAGMRSSVKRFKH